MWTGNYVKFFFFFQIYLLPRIFFNAFQAENYGFRFPSQLVELQLSNAIDSAENSQDFKTATKTLKISSEIKKRGIGECFSPCMGSGDLISFVN